MQDTPSLPEKTSVKLKKIKESLPDGKITIKQLLDLYDGVYILIIILIAPFLLPASIPGSSTPFGILIILLEISAIKGKRKRIPKIIGDYEISHTSIEKMFDILSKTLSYVEKISKPRGRLIANEFIFKFNAFICILLAFLLFLPLPIPFTDLFPAISILLLAVSNLEQDSYLMIIGYIASILTGFYFYSVGYVGIEIIKQVLTYILSLI